ncbi:hypothetical protein NVP1121O_101 [Vibrio phage 1.121.O._10N.286.46.C4]|nr:hypothetical protein NVP1121O_101 [Vibrio phage 1.121.O._10N.286.46.C4]
MIKILLSKDTEALRKVFKSCNSDTKYWLPETEKHPAKVSAWVYSLFSEDNLYTSSSEIVIATHSKVLVDCIGDLVEDGKVSCEEVCIQILNPVNSTFSMFDSSGDLVNWPVGFFSGDR